MRFIAIVAMAIFAGVVYGVLHDQVTARVCVEYFTIGHPPLIASRSPTLLALPSRADEANATPRGNANTR